MPWQEIKEKLYHNKDGLRITSARIEHKGTLYLTDYVYSAKETHEAAQREWEYLGAMVGFMLMLIAEIRYVKDHDVNLLWAILAIGGFVLLFISWQRALANVPKYGFVMNMSNGEKIPFWFGSEEKRDEAYWALSEALAYRHTYRRSEHRSKWQSDLNPISNMEINHESPLYTHRSFRDDDDEDETE